VNDANLKDRDQPDRRQEDELSTADLAGAGNQRSYSQQERRVAQLSREGQPERRRSGTSGASTGTAVAPALAPAAISADGDTGPLFSVQEAANLRSKWDSIQVGFVDEPRRSVQEADSLVASTMQRLAEQFSEERSKLESQWDRGTDVSTEDLRIALRRYRSFFGRLLSV
jgi:hypothetical protein